MPNRPLPAPPPHGGFAFFSNTQYLWLVEALEYTMSSISDLAAKVTEFDSKVDALIAAVNAAKANPGTTLSAADQTALDSAVSSLTTEEAAVEAATPPVPAPPVATPPAAA